MHPLIPHTTTEQRLSKTMQHEPSCDQITNTILEIALTNSDGLAILSNLATAISNLLPVDLCIVIASGADPDQVNDLGYSQSSVSLTETAVEQLSNLSLHQEQHQSPWVEPPSTLFQQLAELIPNIAPNHTWRGISTKFQGRTNGVLLLIKSQPDQWTDEQQELINQILNPIAIAISQAQLQKQSRTKSRYQNLLKNLSQGISQGYRPQVLFQNCLTEIGQTLGLDRCLIVMLKYQNPLRAKERDRELVKGTAKVAYQWHPEQKSLTLEKTTFSFNHSAILQQAWQIAPNCLHLESNSSFPDLEVNELPTQGNALLVVPLMGKKTSQNDSAIVLGFLILQNNTNRSWLQDELELMKWVGVQISTAIIHDQTLNRVQLIVDERTAQLKSSMDMQGKLSAKMRQHIEQLQKVNQLKDDFMNSMSHELKTPLTSMKVAIKMLRQEQIPPAMRERYLDILEQEWNREYNLIKDLLTLQEVESGKLDYSPQELDINRTITDLSQHFIAKWESGRDINLVCNVSPPDLKINTDAESFNNILRELLSNAGKYCAPHTTIELSVSHQVTAKDSEIVISVANIGTGITPEELPHIFDKFRRGQGVTDRAVPGTGLGLTLLQYFVEHLNGKIEVTSQPLEEDSSLFLTIFVLKLPQIQPTVS